MYHSVSLEIKLDTIEWYKRDRNQQSPALGCQTQFRISAHRPAGSQLVVTKAGRDAETICSTLRWCSVQGEGIWRELKEGRRPSTARQKRGSAEDWE